MPNVREETSTKKASQYPEPKLPLAAQRKLDKANEDLAKLTKEQLDILYGVTKPEK